MPHVTAKETLSLLKILVRQGTARKFAGLQKDMESLSAQMEAAAAPLGATPDVASTLQELQQRAADVQRLDVQAETGLGQLAGVLSQLRLENDVLLGQPEQEKVPPKLYIDPMTGTVVEGRIAGRFPQGQTLRAVAALAAAHAPVLQSELSQLVFGEEGREPWLRRRISILNGRAEKLGLPDIVGSPNRVGYVLGPYEVLGVERAFYPQAAPAQAEPVPIAPEPPVTKRKKRPDLAETLGLTKFFYGATVTERTGIPRTALDLMGELGVFKEGVHYVRRGERNIRVYTEAGVTTALDLAKFAKKQGQGRFTERMVRDVFRIPSEQQPENPYGENGPKTVNDSVEFFLLQTVATCLPSLRRTVHADILAGQDEAIKQRLDELKGKVLSSMELEDVAEKRKLAAATASDLINPKKRRAFNFLLRQRSGFALVGELIDKVRAIKPDLLKEFPAAIINPPSLVPHVGVDGRVNGSHRQGPFGDIR